jgi:two-component system chemotaxis response regulator CheY
MAGPGNGIQTMSNAPTSDGSAKGAGRKIFVADDDPIVRKFLGALLSDAGYEVTTASDGEKALTGIREVKPDLVILDLVMPYRDGFEVCRAVRNTPAVRDVPVIILSMKDREADALKSFELGADDFIRKPFNPLELLARIRKILDGRAGKA